MLKLGKLYKYTSKGVEVGPIWWYEFLKLKKMHGLTWPELVELGAPKMEGRCHISMNDFFNKKYSFQ